MKWFGVCVIIIFLISNVFGKEHYPLQPLSALNIADFVLEPSGLTFSATNGHLYAICDRHKCDYIYEMLTDGTPVRRLKYDKSTHDDVEAVACYDDLGLLYIAEEENRRVTAFKLGDYDIKKNEYWLKEVFEFYVEPHGSYIDGSGLEGLTVNTKTGEIYVANEKFPVIFFNYTQAGKLEGKYYPDFSDDISDIFYDSELDVLWALSDKDRRLFALTADGKTVLDYWDLPMKNAEGLAFDNTASPKMMYIATDPSSPHGAQYVAALYTFYKPEIGTGIPTGNVKPYPTIVCDGCDEIEAEAKKNQEAFDERMREYYAEQDAEIVLISLSALGGGVAIIVVVVFAFVIFYGTAAKGSKDVEMMDVHGGDEDDEDNDNIEASLVDKDADSEDNLNSQPLEGQIVRDDGGERYSLLQNQNDLSV